MVIENEIQELKERVCTQESHSSEVMRRLKIIDEQCKNITELSLSVRELAVNMKSMLREQISQGERITRLERAPGARYEKFIFSLISAIAGALVGLMF